MGPVVTPVILSGGSGTRLWPLSLPTRPKQLHELVGDESMFQATVRRISGHDSASEPIVVCNELQVDAIRDQLAAVGSTPSAIVVEPVGRNTAPAVAAAAMLLDPTVVMAVLPADHLIEDVDSFRAALTVAVEAAGRGMIVTFGVVPTRPETGFGYIAVGPPDGDVFEVERFVEKPDGETAERYVASGFLWNSGMFVFTAGAILEELRRFEPEIVNAVEAALDGPQGRPVLRLGEEFSRAPAISLDYAVMERTDRARVLPLDARWSDVGSWHALWEVLAKDTDTVTVGKVYTSEVERSYIHATSRPVAVIGVEDVVVIETPDAVLVIDRNRAQEVRGAADWFQKLGTDGPD